MKIPELLAPVGSMEHLQVAINAGEIGRAHV